jgi:hypothetical protein
MAKRDELLNLHDLADRKGYDVTHPSGSGTRATAETRVLKGRLRAR